MSTRRPAIRPAGRRLLSTCDAPVADVGFDDRLKRDRRVTEDLERGTHNMVFENNLTRSGAEGVGFIEKTKQ